jgi:hypothetical protein
MDKWLARKATELPVMRGERSTHRRRGPSFIVLTSPNASAASSVESGWLQLPVPYSFPQNAILQTSRYATLLRCKTGAPTDDGRKTRTVDAGGVPQLQHLGRS